jgi:hypothetical protein
VASFATVEVRNAGKLVLVSVFVAIEALLELHFEERSPACRHVALRARHRRMFFLQRKGGRVVLSDAELCVLETLYGMTALACSTVFAPGELAGMWIRPVAVRAAIVKDRRVKVSVTVAALASEFRVLPQQWIASLGVIEMAGDRSSPPGGGVVARLATLSESRGTVNVRVT